MRAGLRIEDGRVPDYMESAQALRSVRNAEAANFTPSDGR